LICGECNGHGTLKYFKQQNVKFSNKSSSHIFNHTCIPDELVVECQAQKIPFSSSKENNQILNKDLFDLREISSNFKKQHQDKYSSNILAQVFFFLILISGLGDFTLYKIF